MKENKKYPRCKNNTVSIPYRFNESFACQLPCRDYTSFQFLIGSMKVRWRDNVLCVSDSFNSL